MTKEIIGEFGKHYANGYEYAMNRNRYDQPLDENGCRTFNCSPAWTSWFDRQSRLKI